MLVVADESSLRIGTQSRLSSARKSEQKSHVLVFDSLVAARVKAEYSLVGHPVMHHGEEAFLHLACVLRAEDGSCASRWIQSDASLRVSLGRASVSREFACIVDDEVWMVEAGLELFVCWSYDHVVHEKAMIGSCAENSDCLPVLRIPTDEAVYYKELVSVVEVVLGSLEHSLICVPSHLLVDVTPPNLLVFFLCVRLDYPLVLRRPATLLA